MLKTRNSTVSISTVVPNDMELFGRMVNTPRLLENLPSGHVHVYFTQNPESLNLGQGVHDSVCDSDPSVARAVVNWKESGEKTGVTLAHEIFHTLGGRHAFSSPDWRDKCCSRGDCNSIMDYSNKNMVIVYLALIIISSFPPGCEDWVDRMC